MKIRNLVLSLIALFASFVSSLAIAETEIVRMINRETAHEHISYIDTSTAQHSLRVVHERWRDGSFQNSYFSKAGMLMIDYFNPNGFREYRILYAPAKNMRCFTYFSELNKSENRDVGEFNNCFYFDPAGESSAVANDRWLREKLGLLYTLGKMQDDGKVEANQMQIQIIDH